MKSNHEPHGLTLTGIFERSLRKYANRSAVRVDDRTLTYDALDRRANAVAHRLIERDIESEDRVGLLMSNCLEYVILDLALIKVGAVKVPLNDMLSDDEIEFILSDSEVECLICGPAFAETVNGMLDSLPALQHIIGIESTGTLPDGFETYESLAGEAPQSPSFDVSPGDEVGLFYTGGTTGKPKGVVQTQGRLAMNALSYIIELDISGGDTMLLMTPLPHSAGAFLWGGLLSGSTTVITDGFDRESVPSIIEAHDITWTFMVPAMIYRLLDNPFLLDYDTDSLETLVYGAAPMTAPRLREGIEAFGPVFLQFYGQTELPNLITTLGKTEHALAIDGDREDWLSSAGQPCLMADIGIVDVETGQRLSPGEAGEVIATAPYAMKEYHNRPDATEETLRNGWVRTGDIGRIDDDGYLYLLDRAEDMIITGGMNVYSTEVEDVVDELDSVMEVGVIGVPDEDWGEAVKAIVVPRNGESQIREEVMNFVDGRLADYKKPKTVDKVTELPKTPYGKIDKTKLRDKYWGDDERRIN
jgi:fatty-acyl-CoA synthase/long-chain acyl-CoA synthetase